MIFFWTFCLASSWYEQKMEGWYYFQEGSEQTEELSLEEAEEWLGAEQRRLQQTRIRALLVPTEEHLRAYIQEEEKWKQQSALFADTWSKVAAQRYFLLFCFRGEDVDAASMARRGREFAAERGMRFKALSLDGQGTEGLEEFERDRGLSAYLGVQETPSFYLIDPEQQHVIPFKDL
jgi:conjugal transfer pilus assembly protein TraF